MSSNIRVNRICQYCQIVFEAKTTVTKYCSLTCGRKAYKANKVKLKVLASDIETKQIKAKPLEEIHLREILTVAQAASLLSSSTKAIYNLISSGRIEAVNIAKRKTLILRSEIDMLFKPTEPRVDLRPEKKTKQFKISDCYKIGEVQLRYGISEKALSNLINRKNIPKIPKGRFVYVPKSTIDEIFNQKISLCQK
ncbi:MAG: DNA-binding protein [Chitinophagaceae bacterium]|nr:MAG: DNA-binding protein [Chitinophagaceae bacterium]